MRKKWSKEMIRNEIVYYINQNNTFPTQRYLMSIGRSDIINAIKRHYESDAQLKIDIGYVDTTNKSVWTEQKLIEELKPYLKDYNTIPFKLELDRLGRNDLNYAIYLYGGRTAICKKYGYNLPSKYKTLSSDIVSSQYEVYVNNFLYLNNIPYLYNQIITSNSVKKYRYDFLISDLDNNDVYVEIWGMSDSQYKYLETKELKRKLYIANNLRLIEIGYELFKSDVDTIVENLKQIFISNNICTSFNSGINIELYKKFTSFYIQTAIDNILNYCRSNNLEHFPTKKWLLVNMTPEYNLLANNGIKLTDLAKEYGYKSNRYTIETLEEFRIALEPYIVDNTMPFVKHLQNIKRNDLIRFIYHKHKSNMVDIAAELGLKYNGR